MTDSLFLMDPEGSHISFVRESDSSNSDICESVPIKNKLRFENCPKPGHSIMSHVEGKLHIGCRQEYPLPVTKIEQCNGVIHCVLKKVVCSYEFDDGSKSEEEFFDILDVYDISCSVESKTNFLRKDKSYNVEPSNHVCCLHGVSRDLCSKVSEDACNGGELNKSVHPEKNSPFDTGMISEDLQPSPDCFKNKTILDDGPCCSKSIVTRKRPALPQLINGFTNGEKRFKKRGRPRKVCPQSSGKYLPVAGAIEKGASPNGKRKPSEIDFIFGGAGFVFTEVLDLEADILRERQMQKYFQSINHSWSSSSDSEDLTQSMYESLPSAKGYDRVELSSIISSGGGDIFGSIQELKNYRGKKYLISNGICRTEKFLRAVAANIPCVHFGWVFDSIAQKKCLSPSAHELPYGIEIDCMAPINFRRSPCPFSGTCLYLELEERILYSEVASDAGARIVQDIRLANYVITNMSCPSGVVSQANALNIPMVSVTWLIQCLLRGELLNAMTNTRYAYNVNEPTLG